MKCYNCGKTRKGKNLYCDDCIKDNKRPKFNRTATMQIYDKI